MAMIESRGFIMNAHAAPANSLQILSQLCKSLIPNKIKHIEQPKTDAKAEWLPLVQDRLTEATPRLHNLLWHQLRQHWHNYQPAQQQLICDLGWLPPRPEGAAGSSEDFLYYNRFLLETVNQWLKPHATRVCAWSNDEQSAHNADLPSRMANIKNDYRYWGSLVREYRYFQHPEQLQLMALDELGQTLENIFNKMLVRWNKAPATGFRPPHSIGQNWNKPQYNALADHYSAILNQTYWYLLKWVDHRVQDWYLANQAQVIVTQVDGISWYVNSSTQNPLLSVSTHWKGITNATLQHSLHNQQKLELVFKACHLSLAS